MANDLNCLRTSAFGSRVARSLRARLRLPLYVTLINRGWADAQALCSTRQTFAKHSSSKGKEPGRERDDDV